MDLRRDGGLLAAYRAMVRTRHYSRRTEEAYLGWVRRFVRFHRLRHPSQMAEVEVAAFLRHLAVERKVSAATHGQALSALLFLYREVLGRALQPLPGLARPSGPRRLPVVLGTGRSGRCSGDSTGALASWLRSCMGVASGCRSVSNFG